MHKTLTIAALVAGFTLLSACGGGGGGESLGNAHPWCILADDFIAGTQELSKAYRGDAKISEIEEAYDAMEDPGNGLDRLSHSDLGYDPVAYDAIQELRSDGYGMVAAARAGDDDYEERKDDFEKSKDFVKRVCA